MDYFDLNVLNKNTLLQLKKTGNDEGIVLSSPEGINCGSDCSEDYDEGSKITLKVVEESSSDSPVWFGCDSISNNICSVTMNSDKTITAHFNTVSSIQLIKGFLVKKKTSQAKDKLALILKSNSDMFDFFSELETSSVYISVRTADGQNNLYSREISGADFKTNKQKTRYRYKEIFPEKHRNMFFPKKHKIILRIKKISAGEITDLTEKTKDIRTQITVGTRTCETVNRWTLKNKKKRLEFFFKG